MASGFVPVVDASSLHGEGGVDRGGAYAQTCSSIVEAFCTSGFVCLSNHGIPEEDIKGAFDVSSDFFAQDINTKKKYARKGSDSNHGWVGLETERLNPERPADYKEAFNVTPEHGKIWPDSVVPDFKDALMQFYEKCDLLSNRILKALAVGLRMKDVDYFVKAHIPPEGGATMTTLRCLHYPPLPPDFNTIEGQIRCGEHSDYGSITLLFQEGGLEVMTPEGKWWSPPHLPGTALVNIGDLMQRWTSDKLKSTKHRVMFPMDEATKQKSRKSLAFFVHPYDDYVVECIDGSNKYSPISSLDYLNMRFAATY